MHTLKNFIHYYGPYKVVFFIDLRSHHQPCRPFLSTDSADSHQNTFHSG